MRPSVETIRYPQILQQVIGDTLRLRENFGRQLISFPELPDGSGYILGDAVTKRVITPSDAGVAASLLQAQGEIAPAHLWIMAQKAVPAHIIYRGGRPVAAAMAYMRMTGGNPKVDITHAVGNPDDIVFAKQAICCDAYRRGIDVGWVDPVLQQSYPLRELEILQRRQRILFPPESLGFDEQEDGAIFSSHLPDGTSVIIRPPTASDYSAIETVEQLAFQVDGSDQDAINNFLVRAKDLDKLNKPEHTMLIAQVDGQIVAFAFGFLGLKDRRLVLFSHLAGTVPEFQSRGVMRLLKRAQVISAARLGCSELRWTYDPAFDVSQSNHAFNLNELRCVVDSYLLDVYPRDLQRVGRYAMDEEELRPTDRFEVVQRLTDMEFRDYIIGIRPKRRYDMIEAKQLPVAVADSIAPVARYPVRNPNESAVEYLDKMRKVIPALLARRYEIVSVASDYSKETGRASEAWFILVRRVQEGT